MNKTENEYNDKDWSFEDYQGNNIVSGFLEDEVEIDELCDSDSFSNYEICEHLESYFHFFGNKDMDIIFLCFLSKKKQNDVVQILEKTQPAISYDVTRIKQQMDFVIKVVSFADDFILFISDENGLTLDEKEELTVFFFSTSFVKTARVLNKNSITCRLHIINTVNKLKNLGYIEQYDFFTFILNNLNKVKKDVE